MQVLHKTPLQNASIFITPVPKVGDMGTFTMVQLGTNGETQL
jgi:hypothetical protein